MQFLKGAIFLLVLFVIVGCQTQEEQEALADVEEDTISWIEGFNEEQFVNEEDSFQSAINALLSFYDKEGLRLSIEEDGRGYPNIGISRLKISEKLEKERGLFTSFIDLDYEGAKNEILEGRPLLSLRMVRGMVQDFVFIAGYDELGDELAGYSILMETPLTFNKESWDKDFLYHDINWSVIASEDQEYIVQKQESSRLYWQQMGVEAVLDQDHQLLEQVVRQLREMGTLSRRGEYLNAFYHMVVKKEVTDEVDQFVGKVYEAGPAISYANEWIFLKYWTEGDREKAIEHMRFIENMGKFSESFLESLYLYRDIYRELGDSEQVEAIEKIIPEKQAEYQKNSSI